MKTTAAIADLKANLSRYLTRVKAGQEILVTDRGTAVARIVPIRAMGDDLSSLRDLERQGLIRLGTGRMPAEFWQPPRAKDPKGLVRRAVVDERREGW